ncbi:MAG TPA: hypothetical protein VGF69_13225 [Thermoanaerobaculia bacterium]|jgi:hypothetical protein
MKTFIIILVVILVVIGGTAIYLIATTPESGAGVKLPLSADQRELLTRVPASADAFAFVPTAALLQAKLEANRVTRDPVLQWAADQPLPSPWLLGGADIVAWKSRKRTSYGIRMDPFRAFLVRLWLMLAGDVQARWDGKVFLINAPSGATPEPRISESELTALLMLGEGLPSGDLLVVQREGGRGVFPPLPRPTISSVTVTPDRIDITSRARTDEAAASAPITARFAAGAMISVTFGRPPRAVEDLNRLFGAKVSTIVGEGGAIALYGIDTGTLLPRPKGLMIVPATDARRAEMEGVRQLAELVGETRDTGNELLVSFDRQSMGLYIKDTFEPAPWPASQWAVRLDPQPLIPVLERLGDNTGLRIAAPRLHRAARDLRKWIRYLSEAEEIVAADSVSGGVEEMKVRVVAKR